MSVSTDAVLFWGYCWTEETRLFPEGDWQALLAVRRGHRNPWDDYPQATFDAIRDYAQRRRAEDLWTRTHRTELDAWYAAEEAVLNEFLADLGTHCSGSCPMPYLSAHKVVAHRGHPETVVPAHLVALAAEHAPRWAANLDRWFAELGVERPHPEPGWWLVSDWSD